jgi:hypothetical protein
MIRYNKRIQIKQAKPDQWQLKTDRGDEYELTLMTGTTALTDWWDRQHKSPLREWQMDAVLKSLTYKGYREDYQLFLAHKRGAGLSQPHDIVVFYHHRHKLWVLSTSNRIWFQEGAFSDCDLHIDAALEADVTREQDRKEIYKIIDGLNLITYTNE